MCEKPTMIWHPDGVEYGKIPVSCRRCFECRDQRINDLVGRSMAESAYSSWTVAISLTYADSSQREVDFAHRVLTPSHFQKFIRALRDSHHCIRYLVAGERGGLNGRAHFHALLFGTSAFPGWPDNRYFRWHMEQWPHGFVSTEYVRDARAARYVVKYITKDQSWFSLSKKPPLGDAFFREKAARDFALGVIPWTWSYVPPGCQGSRHYLMTGKTRENYLVEIARLAGVDVSALADDGSPWVRESCDKVERVLRKKLEADIPLDQFLKSLQSDLDRRRPKIVRQVITDFAFDQDVPLVQG